MYKWNREYFEGKPKDLWCYSKKIKFSTAGISKIRQCYLITFFLRQSSFIQEPTGMNLNDSHYFANWKCYSRLNQCRSMHTKWGHIFDAICTISDIIHYTKLCKLARLEWMNECLFAMQLIVLQDNQWMLK